MQTIEVRYQLHSGSGPAQLLGSELLTDIELAPVPGHFAARVFITRCFTGQTSRIWEVVGVWAHLPTPGTPIVVEVSLRPHTPYPSEEYLDALLVRSQGRTAHYLMRGRLVEVDFGHRSSFVSSPSMTGGKPTNPDEAMVGEMHKRRLAVVVSVGRSRVQVAPVTSVVQPPSDKSTFELSAQTLSKLHFYGGNGKPGFVLCSMVETVSVSRILAPTVVSQGGPLVRSYRAVISRPEFQALDVALTHGTGVANYEAALEARDRAAQLELDVIALQTRLDTLQARYDAAVASGNDWQEAAFGLARRFGGSAEEEMEFHRQLRISG